jgi:hypothetical protein
MLLAGNVAMAAPPTSGTLPGGFSTNTTGTTYSGTGSAGTINIGTTADHGQVLQFGGTALANTVTPGSTLTSATNPGFSVGAGATLTINGGAALPTLINDRTGSASQVYGSVNASALGGPLFVTNANGVVVGAGGSLTAPAAGVGLLGYAADSNAFATNGTITINSSTAGTGGVTVDPAATVGGGTLLVASNGAINVGAVPATGVEILAGYTLTTGATIGAETGVTPLPSSAAAVTLDGGTSAMPLLVAALDAAGSVTNSGIVTLPAAGGGGTILGAFTNTGVATIPSLSAGSITNTGVLNDTTGVLTASNTSATSGANITNTGIINVAAPTFAATAGSNATGAATGNFNNTGTINFTTATGSGINSVAVDAENVNFAGTIASTATGATAPSALSATNALSTLTLFAGYGSTPFTGVVDYASTAYTSGPDTLIGGAVRILSGGLYAGGALNGVQFHVGSGSVADPFTGTTLVNNLSVFPGATVQGDYVNVYGTATTPSQAGSNINLDGVLSTQIATSGFYNEVYLQDVNNVTGIGGIALNDGGTFAVHGYTGNINNPNGASAANSTAFQYNYLPIAVANNTSGTAGTANIDFLGQSASSGTTQLVNVLVKGNATLVNEGTPPLAPPASTTGITPASTYTNNHLVVQATGNIQTGSSGFYWPGLVYLNTVASAANPTVQSTTGSITLQGALNNVLPAVVTGGGGIFLETNNLNLNGKTVTTNANSWVNFVSPQVASAYATTSASSFFNAYLSAVTPTVSELAIQALPKGSFQ